MVQWVCSTEQHDRSTCTKVVSRSLDKFPYTVPEQMLLVFTVYTCQFFAGPSADLLDPSVSGTIHLAPIKRQSPKWRPECLPPSNMRLRVLNMLEEEHLATRLEYLRDQRFDGLPRLGYRTKGQHRHKGINGLMTAQGSEDSSRVFTTTGEEEERAGLLVEPGRVCGASDFVMHVDVRLDSNVFGDACGIKIFGCVAVSLEWDECVGVGSGGE